MSKRFHYHLISELQEILSSELLRTSFAGCANINLLIICSTSARLFSILDDALIVKSKFYSKSLETMNSEVLTSGLQICALFCFNCGLIATGWPSLIPFEIQRFRGFFFFVFLARGLAQGRVLSPLAAPLCHPTTRARARYLSISPWESRPARTQSCVSRHVPRECLAQQQLPHLP